MTHPRYPPIIQGGMGVGVSGWRLARAVSSRGQIGVVSGVALDVVLARRLQLGDPGGHMRRALAAFPDSRLTERIVDRYFIAGGKPPGQPFAAKPMVGHNPSRRAQALLVAANFAEVFLAKEGHHGQVGINYLHKIQAPLLASLYGAMLAGVDIVIVGAGIPLEIPEIIDRLRRSGPADMKLHVQGQKNGRTHRLSFDPRAVLDSPRPRLPRPLFFPIASSVTLAALLVRKCRGGVDGLIIEEPTAGGHNAPPRGRQKLDSVGEPIYGPRDQIDLAAIRALGVPFWLAGSFGNPEKLLEARAAGAAGVQVGTLFAFCEESGLRQDLKREVIRQCQHEPPHVFTDPVASPTGFPFKILSVEGTLSDPEAYARRGRQCDLGYLREAYERPDGELGWRCRAEHPDQYVRKGGRLEDTIGRKCLCNGLTANIGMAQIRGDREPEMALLTCGDDLGDIQRVSGCGKTHYSSSQVIDFLLSRTA